MENNELQKLWKSVDSGLQLKSKEELNLLLSSKAKNTLNRFLVLYTISGLTGIGVIVYIAIATLDHNNDIPFLIHNMFLGLVILWSITANYIVQKRLRSTPINQPLKHWLENKIKLLSGLMKPRPRYVSFIVITVLFLLVDISIQVNMSNMLYIKFMSNKETLMGLIISIPIGLFVSFFASSRLRKFQVKNLEFLNDMYNRLCKED